jgi:hypothetical protein
MSTNRDDRTYRLRQLPLLVTVESLPGLLVDVDRSLGPSSSITVWSVAEDLGLSDVALTKTATVTFQDTPPLLNDDAHEWIIEVRLLNFKLKERHGLSQNLLFDTHFLGCTPMNQVDKQSHEFE